MPETKTFKNPDMVDTDMGESWWAVFATGDPDYDGPEGERFQRADWDMEVTFTKKVKPPKFKAGDRVNTIEGGDWSEYPGTVVGCSGGDVYVVWDISPTVVQTFWSEDELHLVP